MTLDYSFRQAVDIAALTNGITWSLFLPRAGVDWKSRKFYTIDIVEQEPADAASKFIDLLSRSNVESGKAVQNAESLHKGRLKKQAIQDALPEAWNRIIGEPDSLLIDLLAERTERISSYKPELSEVSEFLRSNQGQFLLPPPGEESIPVEPHLQTRSRSRSSVPDPPEDQKISQDSLIPHIIAVIKRHGGSATKEEVEKEIYAQFRTTFDHPWYQENVSTGIPRWQHNVAWAKERAKKRGLIKPPSQSGRGHWALTDKGMKFS